MDERTQADMATSSHALDEHCGLTPPATEEVSGDHCGLTPPAKEESSNDQSPKEEAEDLSWGSSSDTMTQYAPINASNSRPMSRTQSRNSISNNHELMSLARTASSGWEGPATDPTKPEFDMDKWLRRTLNTFDQEGIRQKKAGIHFQDLTVSGSGAALQLQSTLGTMATAPARLGELFHSNKEHKQIIRNFNGSLKSGELMIVLGRPGSGCSTFLKTLCGELTGLDLDSQSNIHYNGIPQKQMMKEFKGEVVYNQEVDKHFPHLTVSETLEFAAYARLPSKGFPDVKRTQLAKHMSQVVMAIFGLSHTNNTKVGNDFVRGVSGGERKRVSIAEMALSAAPLAAWDNSTRGLDSASALKFVEALRLNADLTGSAHSVAIYQASQAIYDIFDKAIVLYEGKQIYFGPTDMAKKYFEDMGWFCPARQTTGDFLTSVTNPSERQPREGMEKNVPRTAEEFEQYWLMSDMYSQLKSDLKKEHEQHTSHNEELVNEFRDQKHLAQTKHARGKSPYILSIPQQITLNLKRSYQRIWNDKSSTVANIFGQIVLALIIGSVFYGTPNATQGFQSKGATLFFAVLLNALSAINEINGLYAQRAIVEKQAAYAYYHPFTEALAGFVSDIPIKFMIAVVFNIVLYFLANLRREPSPFFIYFLFVFISTLTMSAIFRSMGAITKTISQAMSLAGVLILALVVYTGFVVPVPYMKPWFSWIRFINPVYFAFEALIANEFHGQRFTCSGFVPAYPNLVGNQFVCSIAGAVEGQRTVSGDAYIAAQYEYYYSHVWRNFGILLAFMFGFLFLYVVATELNSASGSTAEFLVFRRGHAPASMQKGNDEESSAADVPSKEGAESEETVNVIPPQHDIFTWKDVCYDVKIKSETRRLLDNVAGYVKPGTLTALMGTSGAGKTTLLDVLAQRKTTGIISGDMLVNGNGLDTSFQRKTGYVQQQDLHLETATVRESLRFSALLRQPKSTSQQEKFDYVEDVIKMLNMEDFAEAVVGVPGEGLNVEQRKLLTIGVELAAKPKLLLFLDEPTSGLDSQSAWAICAFLRKLADNGQAVLCTIHQPSAILFQTFDRLLFLAKGGHTVYFGPIGKNSRTMLDYFEGNGGRHCDDEENPAEYMLEIVNHTKGNEDKDWPTLWNESEEAQTVLREIEEIHKEKEGVQSEEDDSGHTEFAMPFRSQLYWVTVRTFQQYWRTPSYILAKWMLGIAAGLFIGFSFFQADSSIQGLQNIIFSVFMVSTIFSTLVQQIMPLFVTQRELYEVREKPSKAYSWKAFMIANIVVEVPYNIIMGVLVFGCYYYAVTGIQSSESQILVLLLCIQFFIYAGTFAIMCIAAMPDAQTASTIVTLLFSLSLTFNGVMQSPTALPGFWIFMYRVSPFTYWVAAMVSPQVHARPIICSQTELSVFQPPAGENCGTYLAAFLRYAPGYLQNPTATANCAYCQLSVGDQFLAGANIYYGQRWRNFGIFFAYIFFNVFVAVVLYYGFRVKQWSVSSVPKSVSTHVNHLLSKKPKPMAKNREGHKEMTTAHPY